MLSLDAVWIEDLEDLDPQTSTARRLATGLALSRGLGLTPLPARAVYPSLLPWASGGGLVGGVHAGAPVHDVLRHQPRKEAVDRRLPQGHRGDAGGPRDGYP